MEEPELTVDPHPLLDLSSFATELPRPVGELVAPAWLADLLRPDADAPMRRSEEVRAAVRDLLRHGGYKPTGRGKPASEYLVRAAAEGRLAPINPVVDVCNVVSLHSGLPISLVDLDRVRPPLRVGLGGAGDRYVFNAAGQTIDVAGLLCLFDADGPCANGVKDSQRTKTDAATRRVLTLIWGTKSHPDRTPAATAWYRDLLTVVAAASPLGE